MRGLLVIFLMVTTALALPGLHYERRILPYGLEIDESISTLKERSLSECPSGSSQLSQAEKDAYLKEHNYYRQKEGVPLLRWSDAVAAQAQVLCNNQASCDMQHGDRKCGSTTLGQNLAWDWQSNAPSENMAASKAVGMWYEEKKYYDFGSKTCQSGKVCGHYTQVAWRSTEYVGCAGRICGNSRLLVCDYYPAGNMRGKGPLD